MPDFIVSRRKKAIDAKITSLGGLASIPRTHLTGDSWVDVYNLAVEGVTEDGRRVFLQFIPGTLTVEKYGRAEAIAKQLETLADTLTRQAARLRLEVEKGTHYPPTP